MKEHCQTCKYYKGDGLCRRYPRDTSGKWPATWPEDWCGEYKAHARPASVAAIQCTKEEPSPHMRLVFRRNPHMEQAMRARGLNVKKLAEIAGLHIATVSRVFNGHQQLSAAAAARVASILGTTPEKIGLTTSPAQDG